MINVVKHAYQRYASRIKEIPRDEVEQSIISNRDIYQAELNKMFENSRHIYTGKFNDKHENTNFHIADNMIIITDLMNTKIITLYRVDFGFDRSIDLNILKSLINQLDKAEDEYIGIMEVIKVEKEELLSKRELLSTEIKTLEETLSIMKSSMKSMDDYIKNFGYKEQVAKTEVDMLAKKIVYSNIYRKEMQSCLN